MNDLTRENTPTLLSSLIDQCAGIDNVLAVQKTIVASLEQERTLIVSRIEEEMLRDKLTEAGGMLGRAEFKTKREYRVDPQEWVDLYRHIQATGEFDLLQRRLSVTACDERVKVGVPLPPGVRHAEFQQLEVKPRKKS